MQAILEAKYRIYGLIHNSFIQTSRIQNVVQEIHSFSILGSSVIEENVFLLNKY